MRVVSVGDRRAAQRLVDLLNQAMLNADVDLGDEERKRLWPEVVKLATEQGWVLTKQVRPAPTR